MHSLSQGTTITLLLTTLCPSLLPVALADTTLPHYLILDTGVGHRSTPIPRWATSLRSVPLSASSPNAPTNTTTPSTILQTYGPAPSDGEPLGARSLAYSPSTSTLFLATGAGIVRTTLTGASPTSIYSSSSITSLFIAESAQKLYWGNSYTGLIQRSGFDGSGVETVRNVSQGLNYEIVSGYTPARTYADGILVDEAGGWIYWSASRGDVGGSLRRARLDPDSREEVLASGINMPKQIRMYNNTLYWVEEGRWYNSPTAIKRARIPASSSSTSTSRTNATTNAPAKPWPTQTVIHSNASTLFTEHDYTGTSVTLAIQSFVLSSSGEEIAFVCQSAGRTAFGKLVRVGIGGRKGAGGLGWDGFEVLSNSTAELGVPVGMEVVPGWED